MGVSHRVYETPVGPNLRPESRGSAAQHEGRCDRMAVTRTRRFVLHPTQDQQFQRCPRAFKLGVVDGWQRKEPVTGLAVGKLGHKALEAYYRDGRNPADAFAEAYHAWAEGLEESVTDELHAQAESVHKIMEYYPEWARERDNWAVWYVEQTWEVPVGEVRGFPVILRGRFDLVVHAQGLFWVVDHKFYDRFPALRLLNVDTQFRQYALAARALWPKEPVGGVVVNMLHKSWPKSRSTTPCERHWLPKGDAEIRSAHENLLRRVEMIMDAMETDTWVPNYGWHCAASPFYDVCVAMDTGGNWRDLLELQYTIPEDPEERKEFGWEEVDAA